MSNHNWVELRVVHLTAEVSDDDKVSFYSSPEAIEVAEQDMHIMCWDCKAEPTLAEFYHPCEGAPSEEDLRNK